jgi:23S rRNA pseudouridine2605 synthase
MPRDNDKNNDSSRGRRDRPGGGKGRSGAARGPEKKFAKRGFADKGDGGERRPYAGKPDRAKPYEKKPFEKKPYVGKRDDSRPPRRAYDGDAPRPRSDHPSSDRPQRFNRDDRPVGDKRPYTPRGGDRDARPAARFSDRKFGDKKPYASRDGDGEKRPFKPRGEGFRKDGDRPQRDRPHGDRPERKFGGDKKFSRGAPDRGPRKNFGDRPERGDSKPWQKRDAGPRDDARPARPPRDDARNFDKPRFDKPRYDKPRDGGDERPRFSKSREDRPKFDRPRQQRNAWQEHPRSEPRSSDGFSERPRRDNEDDSKVFAKRPAFGGRGAYRERPASDERRPAARPPREKKSGERIAKVVSRAGLASRRDAEEWITQGRVSVNGRVINSPALDVTGNDVITVDGKPLPPRERTRLWMFHKPRGLMTTHADPEGRPTVFDNLPEGLPRLISIGRLDFNTEGLLLLTNDGGLARALELPDTGWLRRYRVRAHGEVTQAQLDELKKGVEVDGVKYGAIDAMLERDQGANVWLVFAIREGKNREVRNVMAHLGLEVNRLIRISYGPFQLAELEEGKVEEVKTRVLREQLGEKIATLAGADFNRPMPGDVPSTPPADADDAPRGKKPFKPAGKSALIADRKGRRVLVQRTGSEEARARNEAEVNGYGPPRRPQRGYHGKRDLKPLDE